MEFKDRAAVQSDPVSDMREFGTHHQPRGTWSDDSSMLLCTADSLVNHEFSLKDIVRELKPVRYLWPGLILRSLVFFAAVLIHGFRRLAPPY